MSEIRIRDYAEKKNIFRSLFKPIKLWINLSWNDENVESITTFHS